MAICVENDAIFRKRTIFRKVLPPACLLGHKAIECLAKIKVPFQVIKGKVVEKQVFKFNSRLNRTSSQKTEVEVTVIEAIQTESCEDSAESEAEAETEVSGVSLDPYRSNLPAELRLKIWRMCWEPRTVEVHPYINDREQDNYELFSSTSHRSATALPVTLHVCSESRFETLKHYTLTFAAKSQPPQVYFNFNLDRLYLREADMYRGESFTDTFAEADLKRLQRLAIPDRYIQHLLGERARRLSLQTEGRPLCNLLFETRAKYRPAFRSPWQALQELDVMIDDDNRQRDDRVCSWVKEGLFVCAHCLVVELRSSLNGWADGPVIHLEARDMDDTRIEMNPAPPERKPIVQRDGHLIYMPCCRLRPDELLVSLRLMDNPPDKPKWINYVNMLGIQIRKFPTDMPCRCRLESYLLSENLTPFTSRFYNFNRRELGELGRLCKKWLPLTEFHRDRQPIGSID